jgi:glycerophosphoryl diester phosphodiesterase
LGKDFFPRRKDNFVSLVIGHRGAPLVAPENTVGSFRAAADMGADGVELDVRRTADRWLAVVHDAHLPDGRAVVETAWSAMPPGTADLDAVLDACAGLALVNVEIKNWPDDVDFDPSFAHVDAVVAALAGRPAEERSRFVVSCFHLPSVDRVREMAPDLVTAWLVIGPPGDAEAGEMVAEVVAHGHQALHPHHAFVTPALVERAHAEEVAVNPWTCDDPDRIRWLADTGVDAIVTNVPDVALAALGRAAPGA